MENRRKFIKNASSLALASGILGLTSCSKLLKEEQALSLAFNKEEDLFFKISLAEWSLHKSLWTGSIKHLDFAKIAREKFNISAVEYVNQFFFDKATDTDYLNQMSQIANDHGVKQVIIMIDMEGSLGTLTEKDRVKSVDNHYKWIDAAKYLGCHAIRVNAAGKGPSNEVADAVVQSLGTLCEYGQKEGISIIVENHGGYSSDAGWLVNVMKQVDMENCGVLPDFGNFRISLWPPKSYDTYKGIQALMPYAKGVSAKTHDFNDLGGNIQVDFNKAMKIVKDSGFSGYVGIEYEGYKLSEEAGIKATKKLLLDTGNKLS